MTTCCSAHRVRQFIEMVNGTDSEVRCLGGRSPKSQDSYPGSPRLFSSPTHKATGSQAYPSGTYHPTWLFLNSSMFPLVFWLNVLGCSPSLGFDSNYCNGVSSSKAHTSTHSHKPCPVTTGSGELGILNGSHTQQSSIRYSLIKPHTVTLMYDS